MSACRWPRTRMELRRSQWAEVEAGLAQVSERILRFVPVGRQTRLCTTATIDIDATDVEGGRDAGARDRRGQASPPLIFRWIEGLDRRFRPARWRAAPWPQHALATAAAPRNRA